MSVDVATRTVVGSFSSFGLFGAQAVDVASDNRTVVVTDVDNGFITPLLLTPTGAFGMQSSTGTISFERPTNVALAPDGTIGVVCNIGGRSVNVIRINGATLTVSSFGSVATLPGGQHGAVFTPDGSKVLILSASPSPDQVSVLELNESGFVTDTGQRVNLFSDLSSVFLGVDVIAVTPDGTKAYVGNTGTGSVVAGVTVIDLTATPPVVHGMIPMATPVAIAFP